MPRRRQRLCSSPGVRCTERHMLANHELTSGTGKVPASTDDIPASVMPASALTRFHAFTKAPSAFRAIVAYRAPAASTRVGRFARRRSPRVPPAATSRDTHAWLVQAAPGRQRIRHALPPIASTADALGAQPTSMRGADFVWIAISTDAGVLPFWRRRRPL